LAKEFESSQTYGTAKVTSAGLSYQALRSQQSNLTWRGSVQHKRLNDNSDTFLTRYEKSSVSVPFSLQFDHRDNVGAGGVTYGAAGWTLGRLKLDAGLIEQDLAQTSGQFSKITLDVARVQNLGLGWSAYGHMTGQYTDKNLDSSELMSLGGATGVRAYPSGEASGDRGWLAQLELRWSSGAWTPYLLFDQGRVQVNARPELLAAPSPDRTLAGAGLGLRFTSNPWRADFTLAWRTQGGVPQADTSADPKPRAWLSGEYVF
jgi:hemolysin activation/secretion protein